MMLSTKARYAVMAMVDLAQSGGEQPMTLATIAERQEIPLPYLEQIFARLKKSGLVASVRGPGGGYSLARAADDISVADIVNASEESLQMTRCDSQKRSGCMASKAKCMTHDLWDGLEQNIQSYLGGITLADVCSQNVRHSGADQSPHLAFAHV